jgi:hypothetical protein
MKTLSGSSLVAALVLLTALAPTPPHAQQPDARTAASLVPTVPPSAAMDSVRLALRALVGAEEAFFADHGTYTTDLSALVAKTPIRVARVIINVSHAGGLGWRASARHADYLDKSCVAYVGAPDQYPMPMTKSEKRQPTSEGRAVCDAP